MTVSQQLAADFDAIMDVAAVEQHVNGLLTDVANHAR